MGLRISASKIYFVDSNIFIYALEASGEEGGSALQFFKEIKNKNPRVFTSVVTISEVMIKVFERKLDEKIDDYLGFISGNGAISIVEISRSTAILAAKLRAEHRFKTPDAMQIASALLCNANEFVTADRGFPKKIEKMLVRNIFD